MINLVSDKPHYENVPFEIPESWEWVTLGAIGTWQAGGTPNRGVKEYYGGDIPWLKTGDLNDGYITNIPECITKLGLDKSSAKLNPKDSVLIAMYGATIGKVGILTFPATTNQACCACIEYPAVDKLYLYYFLLSHREIFISRGGGGAQPNISKEIILATQFPLPPHAEQQRIVAEVEKWFAIIDALEANKEDLKDYIKQVKSKVLSLAISGKLVPQDPNDEPAIELLKRIDPNFKPCDTSHYENLPSGWTVCSIKDISKTISSRQYQVLQSDICKEGIFPVVSQSANYIEGYCNLKDKVLEHKQPVIVFGDHTRVVKYIDFDFIVGADGVKILSPMIDSKYFYYLILNASENIKNRGYGRHFGLLSKEEYFIPPLKEQHRIVSLLETIEKQLDTISAEL